MPPNESTANPQELSSIAASLFISVKTNLTIIEKNQVAYLTGITPEELNTKTKKGNSKYEVNLYPLDWNKDGTEEIFLCVTSKQLGISTNTYFYYAKNNTGKYQALPGKIGQGVKLLLNGKKGYPDLITGTPGLSREVWSWNGKTYQHLQNISGTTALSYKTIKIEDASKEYTDSK